ncbi:hypothetical protein RR48_05200 [Papilio machaon]|uniref:Uncharacterized protein n=1 Tax=Papilio machaon TaxID=76193 RepID=A0A0N1PHS8_PAPMA|nr:hypothetical protein RR48_05200 [Papilio machaon]
MGIASQLIEASLFANGVDDSATTTIVMRTTPPSRLDANVTLPPEFIAVYYENTGPALRQHETWTCK